MSDQLLGVIIGGIIGIVGSLIGALVNHWLTVRRDLQLRKLEERDKLRSQLTDSASDLVVKRAVARVATVSGEIRQAASGGGVIVSSAPRIMGDTEEKILSTANRARTLANELSDLRMQIPSLPAGMIENVNEIANYLVERNKELQVSGECIQQEPPSLK